MPTPDQYHTHFATRIDREHTGYLGQVYARLVTRTRA